MSKIKKLALGAATLWPLIYLFLFFAFFAFASVWITSGDAAARGDRMRSLFGVFFASHVLTMIWIFVLVAIYIWMLFKTDRVPQDKKALWAVVLFLGNTFAMPVFWFLYIWREPQPAKGVDGNGA